MSLRNRLGWLLALFLVQLLYIPINRTVSGGVQTSIALDGWIPLYPVWTIPYVLSLVWWAGFYTWAGLKMDDRLYTALIASTLFTMLTAYTFYLLYPTYVIRPSVEGNGWQYDMLRRVYAADKTYNAFPSGHTYTSLLILFYWWRWRPQMHWLWVLIVAVVLLSTLFTGQHNLADLLGGGLWAGSGYYFGQWCTNRFTRS